MYTDTRVETLSIKPDILLRPQVVRKGPEAEVFAWDCLLYLTAFMTGYLCQITGYIPFCLLKETFTKTITNRLQLDAKKNIKFSYNITRFDSAR